MIAAVYCYFSLFHSLCLLLLSVFVLCLLVFPFFVHFVYILRSRIFTTVLLILCRQLVELCVFLVVCHCICLQFDMKIWQIN